MSEEKKPEPTTLKCKSCGLINSSGLEPTPGSRCGHVWELYRPGPERFDRRDLFEYRLADGAILKVNRFYRRVEERPGDLATVRLEPIATFATLFVDGEQVYSTEGERPEANRTNPGKIEIREDRML